jgi:hypothetical protein
MRPEEENVQLVQRFYHVAPPPLVFVGEYAKPVLDANAMSSMTHASAFNTDAIYRGFGNPTQEAEIALHEGVASKYKARKFPAITPYTGSIFEAKPLDDPSPEEQRLRDQEAEQQAEEEGGGGGGDGNGPSANTPGSSFSPGGPARRIDTGISFSSPTGPTGLDAAGVRQGTDEQTDITANTQGSVLPSVQPPPPPGPQPDTPNQKALKAAEASKQAAEENARQALAASREADAAAEAAATSFLGKLSPVKTRADRAAKAAKTNAEKNQAYLEKVDAEVARLMAAVAVENQAAGVRTRNQSQEAAKAVEASRAVGAPGPLPGSAAAAAPLPAAAAASRPSVQVKIGQPLPGVKRLLTAPRVPVSTQVAQLIRTAAEQGIDSAPAAIASVVGAITGFLVQQWKAAPDVASKNAALDNAAAAFAIARAQAARENVDLAPLEGNIQNVGTTALGTSASPELISGLETAINKSRSLAAEAIPDVPNIFSPSKPRGNAASAAPVAEPDGTETEAQAAARRSTSTAAAAAAPPPAAAAAAPPAAAAAPPAAAAAPPPAAAAAPPSPLQAVGVDVRKTVLGEFSKIKASLFNKSKEAMALLKPALTQVLRILAMETKLPADKVTQAVDYMIETTEDLGKADKTRVIKRMIEMSMQSSPLFVGDGPHQLKPPKNKVNPDPFLSKTVPGPVSGVMGGFGKPMSAKRPRFEKGSDEARAYMAELRAKRRK